jgi:glycosyltransferase involved in cell wall biosynthesis
MGPLVSILINNYNYAAFVAGAIESALSQTYARCEVIVVDDGSTDASREIVGGFGDRIVPVFKSNGGQASAFNAGYAHARGEIICFLDSDDLFLPTKVEQVVLALDGQPRGWCFHHLQWTDKDLKPIEMPVNPYKSGNVDVRSDVLSFTPPSTSGLAFTRNLLEQILPMPEAIKITSDNYMKFSSMALAPGYYIEEQLSLQRIHGSNLYTCSENTVLKAEVQMATAFGLRKQFPVLRQTCNRMYADGLAVRLHHRQEAAGIGDNHLGYLDELSLVERATLYARVTYKMARRNLRRRVDAAV